MSASRLFAWRDPTWFQKPSSCPVGDVVLPRMARTSSSCFLARQGLTGLLGELGKGSRDQVRCKWVAAALRGRIDDPAQREWHQDRQGLVDGDGGVPDVLEEKASDGATKRAGALAVPGWPGPGPARRALFSLRAPMACLRSIPFPERPVCSQFSHLIMAPLQVKAAGDPLDPPYGASVCWWSIQWRVLGHERERGTPSVKSRDPCGA